MEHDVDKIILKSVNLVQDHMKSFKELFPDATQDELDAVETLIRSGYVQGYLRSNYDQYFEREKDA